MREVYRNAQNIIAWVGSISTVQDYPNSAGTSEDMTRDSKAIVALASLERDMLTARHGPWHFLTSNEYYRLDLRQHLKLALDYLRIRYEMLRGILLGISHTVTFRTSPIHQSSSDQTIVHLWHYTVTRCIRPAAESPLTTLLRRPYFTRRWILQELGSARVLGAILFQWDKFTFPIDTIWATLFSFAGGDKLPERHEAAFRKFSVLIRAHILESRHEIPAMDFLLLGGRVHALDCQDPRDRVFALLGL